MTATPPPHAGILIIPDAIVRASARDVVDAEARRILEARASRLTVEGYDPDDPFVVAPFLAIPTREDRFMAELLDAMTRPLDPAGDTSPIVPIVVRR